MDRRAVAKTARGGALTAICALAAAVRLAHIDALRATPWFANLTVDPAHYDAWARRLAAGEWLGSGVFYMDPLYPYVLGVLYRLAGPDLLWARLLNVAFDVGSCLALAALGRALAGPAAGLLAAFAFALYPPAIFHAGEIDKTSLSFFLVAAGLASLLHRTPRACLAAGVSLGLAILTRANVLAFVPVAAALLYLDRGRESRRRGAAAAALLVVGVLAALAPVTLRNRWVAGEWVLTTSQAGQNFYIGNCPENPAGAYGTLPFVRGTPEFEEDDFRAEAERRSGRSLRPTEVSRFWLAAAVAHMRARPDFAASVLARKLALFWNDFEIADSSDQYLARRFSAVMRAPLPGFGWITALAAVGLLATLRQRPEARLLAAFVAVYSLSVTAFFIMSRYRIQVAAASIPLAAAGVLALGRWLRAGEGRRLAVALLLAGAVAAFSFRTIGIFSPTSEPLVQMQLHRLGQIHTTAGDPERALEIHREAADGCEHYCNAALDDVFEAYRRLGRSDEARRFFEAFLRRHPGHERALAHLAALAAEDAGPAHGNLPGAG